MSLFFNIIDDLIRKINVVANHKEVVASVISTITGAPISPNQLDIKNKTVFLSVSPTIKTSILLKKETILKELQKYQITTIG